MAMAFDASGTFAGGGGNGTYSLTIGSGANRVLIVGNSFWRNGGTITSGAGSVTFQGTAMTFVTNSGASQNQFWSEQWYFLNPPTGLGTVIVYGTTSNTTQRSSAASFSGVNQSNPIDTNITVTSASADPITGTITTNFANEYLVDILSHASANNITAGSNQTEILNVNASGVTAGASYQLISTAGPGTMKWTSPGGDSAYSILALKAITGAGTNLIQSTGTATLGIGSTSVTWASNTTTGNLIVVGVTLTNAAVLGTVSSITDSQSNTYNKAISGTISSVGDVLNTELWYAKSITGGAGSITVNHTVDACAIYAREYSGFNTLDVTSSANGSSTTPNSGTSNATNQATELIIVATGDDKGATQTWTAAGNYGNMTGTATTITGISMEDNIVTSTGAQTGTLTLGSSANWESLLATFYNLISTGVSGWKGLMGVGN